MAKTPEARYPTALALARALQQVQTELALAVTPVDLLDEQGHVQEDTVDGPADEDDVGTRLREVVSVDPLGPASSPVRPDGGAPARRTAPGRGPVGVVPGPAVDGPDLIGDTVHRSMAPAASARSAASPDVAPAPTPERPVRRGVVALVAGLAVLALAAVVTLAVVLWPDAGAGPEASGTSTSQTQSGDDSADDPGPPSDNLGGIVPAVTGLQGTANPDGTVTFTWQNPSPQPEDRYGYRIPDPLEESRFVEVLETTKTVDADPSGRTCIEVVIVRDGAFSFEARAACVP
jgi:hypothetical protein